MPAGKVPTSNITALYNNTTAGTDADPAAVDNAVQDIVQTINDNFDKHVFDISTHASAATLAHPDGSVTRLKLADKVVGAGQLDDAAVGQSHHQDNGIPGRALPDNVIAQRHMSDGSVGPAELQAGAVTATKIPNGTINSQHIDAALLASSASLSTQAEFDKRGINVQKYANLVVGLDWLPAIQAACDAAAAQGLKIVRLPDGTFNVSDVFNVPSGVSIFGAGRGNTIIKALTAEKNMCNLVGNSVIADLTLDGADKSKTGVYIQPNSFNVRVRDVEIKNIYSSTAAYGITVSDNSDDVKIERCYIHHINSVENGISGDNPGANRGVIIFNAKSTTVSKCVFDYIRGFEDGDAIYAVSPKTDGVHYDISDIVIEGNTFTNIYKRGVKLQASGARVVNNLFSSAFVGGGDPFSGDSCAHAAVSVYADNCVVTGNTIKLPRAIAGIELLQASKNVITNNVVEVDTAKLYADARISSQRAVAVFDGCDGNEINNNVLGCNAQGIYSRNSSGIVMNDNTFLPCTDYPIYFTNGNCPQISGNTIRGADNNYNTPYQAFTLDNVFGTALIVGNTIERAQMGVRLSNTIDDLRIHGNSFADVVQDIRTTELTAGQDINITVSDGQFKKQVQMSAIPTTGSWSAGDVITNTAPTIGGNKGWECTTSGTFTANSPWTASTAYTVGTHVSANSKVYKCVTGGTSGTTAPFHVIGKSNDGSVTWLYVGAVGTPVFRPFGRLMETKSGLFTGNGDGTNKIFNIPHGIATGAPWAMVQPSNAAAGTATVDYVTCDSTNIIVTFKTAPVAGTGNVIMRWMAEK